ncbi:MAG: bifunctional precorrin-2 dehydrogenase/sirohydrochlorin ferrochelatase, partial [Chloroflexota bacterium]|nr:bifunctional precorrin-2 dehydrogenase/sirohydrochlorin ferrochelatase [Chloroflexota bacterium]
IAPEALGLIEREAASGALIWHRRPYRPGDLADADLVLAATDDRGLNAQVAQEARERGVPVLAVDDIPNCDFIAPAVVKRGRLTVAISTAGRSPAMASHVRRKLEADLTPEWGDLLEVAATVRDRLGPARSGVSPQQWQDALDGELKALVWAGDLHAATELLYQRLRAEAPR